ncbi:MAG: glycoside hydrolase family protein [Azoarcus sp.]|nr:glycoside hydrolase family protein [Azoarcus sp.]
MKARTAVAGLTMMVTGFTAYIGYEGFVGVAAPPVKGDAITYGHGTTKDANGNPLKAGATITPVEAVKLAARDVCEHEGPLKKCLAGVALHSHEFDAYMSLALNVGTAAVCGSSIPDKLQAEDYAAACKTILDFAGYCTKPKIRNAAGRLVCPPGALKKLPGLVRRREAEYRMCMGEAQQ